MLVTLLISSMLLTAATLGSDASFKSYKVRRPRSASTPRGHAGGAPAGV
ncbi:MAG: hypothetical protein H6811_05415 [Phycisphaeraceae bacterium]|nr:hypothetical protein [Phycisphaeraceae bacterium]